MKAWLKGGLIGLIIGIISFIGSTNWYGDLGILGFVNFPLLLLWKVLLHLNWDIVNSWYIGFIDLMIFTSLGVLFGNIYENNKRTFWIVFIISLILYIILWIVCLFLFLSSFA